MRLIWGVDAPASVDRYLLPDEHQLICVREHPAVLLGPFALATAGLVAAVLLTIVAPVNTSGLLVIWLAWGVLLLRAGWTMAVWSVNYLVVTAGRLLLVYGLVNRKVSTILLSDVTDLTMRRSLPGLLLGYGRLIAEHDLPDQPLGVVSFVAYPDQVYLASWLAPDPRDSIKDLVLRICGVVGPVSPFKVVRLLEQTSGDQVRDSPAVARELLYRTVADRLDEDRSLERRPELRSYLADYRNYLRRRNNTENARWSARLLTVIAIISAIALGVLFGIERYGSVRPISLGWALSLFIVAASLSVLLIALIWLLTRRIDSLSEQVASTAGRVHDEMLNDFKAIASVLSVELQRASTDPMLQLSAAPALIELESARVQPFASFKDGRPRQAGCGRTPPDTVGPRIAAPGTAAAWAPPGAGSGRRDYARRGVSGYWRRAKPPGVHGSVNCLMAGNGAGSGVRSRSPTVRREPRPCIACPGRRAGRPVRCVPAWRPAGPAAQTGR
jgi:hypothetical protein